MQQDYISLTHPISFANMSIVQKRSNYALYWDTHKGYQVAYNLYLHKIKKGWDKKTLAHAAGVSTNMINQLLNNLKENSGKVLFTPSLKTITKINKNLLNFYPVTTFGGYIPFIPNTTPQVYESLQ